MANHLDLEEQEQLDQLKHFWNTWGTLISSVLLVIFGGLAAWNGYQYWQSRQAAQGAALLDAVEVAAKSGDNVRLDQAFADLKANFARTGQASQAGFTVAKTMQDAGDLDKSKAALGWVVENSPDEGHQALARLRLASVLMEQKSLEDATKLLSAAFPVEFDGVVADRKGDLLLMQDKRTEAAAEYLRAYKAFDDGVEYRRLVEMKLNALGVSLPNRSVSPNSGK